MIVALFAIISMGINFAKVYTNDKPDTIISSTYDAISDDNDDEEESELVQQDPNIVVKAFHQHHHKKPIVRHRRRSIVFSVNNVGAFNELKSNFIQSGAEQSHVLAAGYHVPQPFYYTQLHRCSLF